MERERAEHTVRRITRGSSFICTGKDQAVAHGTDISLAEKKEPQKTLKKNKHGPAARLSAAGPFILGVFVLETINKWIDVGNSFLWDFALLFLLCGTGIFFTVKLGFVQVRFFKDGMRRVFGNIRLRGDKAGASGMSSFQSLATAVAAQVGTGNIAGAATAIASGGPGAIFWMWLSAFFGMATILQRQRWRTIKKRWRRRTAGRSIFRARLQPVWQLLACFFSHAIIFTGLYGQHGAV